MFVALGNSNAGFKREFETSVFATCVFVSHSPVHKVYLEQELILLEVNRTVRCSQYHSVQIMDLLLLENYHRGVLEI